jgi:hypothetical protein
MATTKHYGERKFGMHSVRHLNKSCASADEHLGQLIDGSVLCRDSKEDDDESTLLALLHRVSEIFESGGRAISRCDEGFVSIRGSVAMNRCGSASDKGLKVIWASEDDAA